MYRTYTVKGLKSDYVWLFKYDLNGLIAGFQVVDGQLTQIQWDWLFKRGEFPTTEAIMKQWLKVLRETFEIVIGEPELTFDALWELYDNKVSKKDAQKAFGKLSDADRIKCFLTIPHYKKYLSRKGTGQAHLATFINKEYYNDDYSKIK